MQGWCAGWGEVCLLTTLLWHLVSSSSYVNSGELPDFRHEDENDCPSKNDRWITVKQYPWGLPYRAFHTIPPEFYLDSSNIPEAGVGIFSHTFIPRFTWLGEYEGEIIVSSTLISEYAFKVPRDGIVYYHVDAFLLHRSNWLRWVNCARNSREENVIYKYCQGKVYYMTLHDIHPGQELLLYYGDEYAKDLGILYKVQGNKGSKNVSKEKNKRSNNASKQSQKSPETSNANKKQPK